MALNTMLLQKVKLLQLKVAVIPVILLFRQLLNTMELHVALQALKVMRSLVAQALQALKSQIALQALERERSTIAPALQT